MNILVSNDDGIQAKGLRVLTEALSAVPGCRVFVSAPNGQRSACGHGISMNDMIRVFEGKVPGAVMAQSISGTPADSVKFGIRRLRSEFGIEVDAVFSGINHGGNIGSDVHYSGTVSAAAEGLLCGVPAVAVSVKAVPEMERTTLLNVNLPAIPLRDMKGLKVTRLGPREYDENFDILVNPREEKYFWYSGKLVEYSGLAEDLDTMAQQDGYVSVTPLKLDMTDHELREKVKKWDLQFR